MLSLTLLLWTRLIEFVHEIGKADYVPSILESVVEFSSLCEAQLASIVYGGQAHEQMILDENGTPIRQGYILGDALAVGIGGLSLQRFSTKNIAVKKLSS